MLIIMLVSIAGILLSGVSFITYEWFSFRRRMVEDLTVLAEMIADNCTGSLSFDDPKDAEEVLKSLRAKLPIELACIYREDGKVFATYHRSGLSPNMPPGPAHDEYRFGNGRLVIFKQIILNNQSVGTIYLQSDLSGLSAFLKQSAIALALMILLLSVIAYFLASRLQKVVSMPIFYLAKIAKTITLKGDYSLRAIKHSKDELGELTDAFNNMLIKVEYRDISLRESEKKYRMLIENAGVPITFCAVDGKIILINAIGAKHLGGLPDGLVGKSIYDVLPGIADITRGRFLRIIETGTGCNFEDEIELPSGNTWFNSNLQPMKNANGEIFSIQIVSQDITERKRTEKEMEKYRRQLEVLVKERTQELEKAQEELVRKERLAVMGQLTATVSHELRNPLGTVSNAVFSIGDAIKRNEKDRVDRSLKLAERNIKRCDRIINELLDFTRNWEIKFKQTDIDSWLGRVLDEQQFTEGIECVRELQSGIVLPIDSEHLRRAVVNVVSNAIQALQDEKSRGNRLTVKSAAIRGRLELRFIDTGPGIRDELLDKIFEPLFSTKSFGIGLGIPIIKNIMEKHHGGIEFQSKAGKGTTVILWMPIQKLEGKGCCL